ncbi:MAG: hypothetical protein QOE14_297, partial [Humisphaera sp.]|nr:hypothetical protein [Humisphaera sp.]
MVDEVVGVGDADEDASLRSQNGKPVTAGGTEPDSVSPIRD